MFLFSEHLSRPQSSQSTVSPPSRQGRRKSSANWTKARTSLALSGDLRKRSRVRKWAWNWQHQRVNKKLDHNTVIAPLQHFFFLIQIFFYSFKVDSSEHIFMPPMEKALVNFPETQYLHKLYFQFKDFVILLKLNLLSRYYIYASHGKSTCTLLWNSVFTKMTFLILLIAQTHTSISNTLVMQMRAS